MKTTNGVLISGYYSGNYNEKDNLTDFSMLISLTNSDCYLLLPDSIDNKGNKKINKGMVYDKLHATYGNAELRIKTGEKKVFSNFGIMNSYFDHRGKKIADFMNS